MASKRKQTRKPSTPKRTTSRSPAQRKKTTAKASSSLSTTNHDKIRAWVEERGGKPARVKATGRKKGDPGILRVDFPGYSGEETLEAIDWDTWLDAFEDNQLEFVYEERAWNGRLSRFSKLVARQSTPRRAAPKTAKKKASTARRSSTAAPSRRATTARKAPTKKRTTKRARPASSRTRSRAS